jgi:hypothetical protein
MVSFQSYSIYQTQVTLDAEHDGDILLSVPQSSISNIKAKIDI